MSGLTQENLDILSYYAQNGNRERYWNYLATLSGNDGYGRLALGVVRNDNMPGKTANIYAEHYVLKHDRRQLSEREWEKVGVDLIQADFKQRQDCFKGGRADFALNLPAETVYYAHQVAFQKNHISREAWTPAALLDAAAHKTHGHVEGNRIWHYMLDNQFNGSMRALKTSVDSIGAEVRRGYLAETIAAYSIATQSLPYTNVDKIGYENVFYQKERGARGWAHHEWIPAGPDQGWRVESVDDPQLIRQLNDAHDVRQHRFDLQKQKHRLDPNDKLLPSKSTIAQNEHDVSPALAQTPSAPVKSEGRQQIERMYAAMIAGDGEAFAKVQTEMANSPAGLAIIAKGVEIVNEQERQQAALAEQQALEERNRQAHMEADAMVRRGPVIRM